MYPKCEAVDVTAAIKPLIVVLCVRSPKDPTLKQHRKDCYGTPSTQQGSVHTNFWCSIPTHPLHLQEELEAYDRHQRLLEDNLDSKTAEIIQLRRAALEAAAGQLQQVRTMKRGCGWGEAVPNWMFAGLFVSLCHLGN